MDKCMYCDTFDLKGTIVSEVYSEMTGYFSGEDTPVNYCPNCGKKIDHK